MLLSNRALMQLYGESDGEIAGVTKGRRPHWVEIDSSGLSRATLRDQKPLSEVGLRRALPPGVELWEWYELINSMVFFWPTKKWLETVVFARACRDVVHDVLVVDTQKLVRLEEPNIRLS